MADLFFHCCSKDYSTHAMQMCLCVCACAHGFVCVIHDFGGMVMIGSFWLCFWAVDASSVFISSYSYISIFLTVLSGRAVYVMGVYGTVRAGLYAEPH